MTDITSILSKNNIRFLSKTFPSSDKQTITRTIAVEKVHNGTSTTGMVFYHQNGRVTYRLSQVDLKKGKRPKVLNKTEEVLDQATADITEFLGLATN